ncbi:replication/maintenance protein RepL [Sulfurimonas sp. RIFOXYB12_FULL_35_9]|jgi:hypothetical protein|uniref:replication/maintenance protein RepL n=1 Tax=Sulfurimonas sp. RIFOXYB12_FULL_35_9 TaxID=1802256 RepID=UPI0008CBABD6|nr:replication/maintenance protein RepL [Sulfurimonas sp. RIFOXYB12_FULL_35_9]OHE04666.1 MAG: hypothetical protein A2345_12290 [Sulfurimonas sp. RIFOXYB12_FULL_35_9]
MEKMKRTLAYLETNTTINELGETVEREQIAQFKAEVEPSYIKLYIEDIAYFYKLDISSDLMYALLKYVNYEQEIIINKAIKERIAKELDKSLSFVNNNLTKLVNNEVLIRVNTGVYTLNTYLFGKGSWKDIMKHRKSLKLNVFYSAAMGRQIKKEEDERRELERIRNHSNGTEKKVQNDISKEELSKIVNEIELNLNRISA